MNKVVKDLHIYTVDLYYYAFFSQETTIVLELQSMQSCIQYHQLKHHEINR